MQTGERAHRAAESRQGETLTGERHASRKTQGLTETGIRRNSDWSERTGLPPSSGGHDSASSGKKAEAPPTARSLSCLAEHASAPALSRLRQNNQRRRDPPLSQPVGPRPLGASLSHGELHRRPDGVGRPGRTKVCSPVCPRCDQSLECVLVGPGGGIEPQSYLRSRFGAAFRRTD